jgi:formyl-CoA transferase
VDQIAQGMGGLMSITGLPGQGPVRVGIPIADLTSGNLLAYGVMVALFDRMRTGEGRWVHTSLLEAQIFMLDFQASRWLMKGEVAGQAGNDHPTGIPTGVFPTTDGHITMAASSARLWERFCDTIGKADWKVKPEWTTQGGRSADRKNINAMISEVTATKPAAHWIELFEEAGIPCGPIYTIDQVFADPQVKHLEMARPMEHPRLGTKDVVASPLNFSGLDRAIRDPTPEAGQHTDEILGGLGYSPSDIGAMRAQGII